MRKSSSELTLGLQFTVFTHFRRKQHGRRDNSTPPFRDTPFENGESHCYVATFHDTSSSGRVCRPCTELCTRHCSPIRRKVPNDCLCRPTSLFDIFNTFSAISTNSLFLQFTKALMSPTNTLNFRSGKLASPHSMRPSAQCAITSNSISTPRESP